MRAQTQYTSRRGCVTCRPGNEMYRRYGTRTYINQLPVAKYPGHSPGITTDIPNPALSATLPTQPSSTGLLTGCVPLRRHCTANYMSERGTKHADRFDGNNGFSIYLKASGVSKQISGRSQWFSPPLVSDIEFHPCCKLKSLHTILRVDNDSGNFYSKLVSMSRYLPRYFRLGMTPPGPCVHTYAYKVGTFGHFP